MSFVVKKLESKMIEVIGTVTMILAIAGVLLNNRRLRACFIVWMFSNALSFWIHLQAGILSLCLRDAIFLALAIEGLWMWRKKQTTD